MFFFFFFRVHDAQYSHFWVPPSPVLFPVYHALLLLLCVVSALPQSNVSLLFPYQATTAAPSAAPPAALAVPAGSVAALQHANSNSLSNAVSAAAAFGNAGATGGAGAGQGGADRGSLYAVDDLPKTVARTLSQGSCVMTMDWHPLHHTLLLGEWE